MTVTVSAPTFEHHREPLGIGEAAPRLSWRIDAPAGWTPASAVVEIERDGVARSFEIAGGESVLRDWPDAPLASRERVSVRVKVRGTGGDETAWSAAASAEAGLLAASDWIAMPVGGSWDEDPNSDDRRPSLVRRSFELDEAPVRARLYASAHGLYELELNGARVGDDAMSPGWTPYRDRLRYYSYDVTGMLAAGENVLGSWLGDGWYRGRVGWREGFRNVFGTDLSLIAQLELTFADGSTRVIATDDAWTAHPGPIVRSGNYDGEDYDARAELPGWSTPGYDASAWTRVVAARRDMSTLVAPSGPPVRCTEEVAAVAVTRSASGGVILDFGQNLVGRLRIRVRGEAGRTVTIRTAEVLQDGELYTRPLRSARSTDNYVLAGRAEGEEWEPRFTFHGFRYAEITGWPGLDEGAELDPAAFDPGVFDPADAVARVYHTDFERTGWFESSDPDLDRLHENVVWSMRGNFLDIPTDCPQRDERAGWTGDIQVFGPTASALFDVSGMLTSWLRDVAVEQLADGSVPWYVPVIPADGMWTPIRPGAAWGDVATFLPWTLYQRFGDRGILADQFESARRWVDLIDRISGPSHLWDTGFQLGDWLDPAAPPENPADAATDSAIVATAYFAASTRIVADMAQVLGLAAEEERYRALAAAVREAFVAAYVRPDGRMTSDAQTAYSLAIAFDLVDDEERAAAGDRLAELVAAAGNRIATGFVGTPLVSDALTVTGHLDSAYDLVLERSCPSWLYQVSMGATTIWERWDAMRPDGTVNPGSMTSFNHYALGAVADWLHRVVAGLAPAEPGYRRIRFAPRPGGGLTRARAEHLTPYGTASIAWRLDDGALTVDVVVPTGATAVLDLEGEPTQELTSGTHRVVVPAPLAA